MARILQFSFALISILSIVHAAPVCDSNRYGSPHATDCVLALSQLIPTPNKNAHYFVEEPRRSTPQSPIFPGFRDIRPGSSQEDIVQLPKWTSYGDYKIFPHEPPGQGH